MNIAIVYGSTSADDALLEKIVRNISRALEEMNHTVSLYNAYRDTDARLSYCDFVIIVTKSLSFISSKIPDQIRKYLREVPGATGKRSMGIITSGLRANAALQTLMKTMEAEGMLLINSMVIKKENEAYTYAKHFKLERS